MINFIESLQGKTVEQLEEVLYHFAEKGDLEKVKALLNCDELKNHQDVVTNNDTALIYACVSGNVELVKYILTSPELQQHPDIHYDNDLPLSTAAKFGNLDLVKFFLESPELVEHSQVPFSNRSNYNPIVLAAKGKHLFIFEYLVNFADGKDNQLPKYIFKAANESDLINDLDLLKSFIKILENKNEELICPFVEGIIYNACSKDNVEAVKYVFDSSNLRKHIDIHKDNDEIFREILVWARTNKSAEVARYFILDLNIEETESINKLRLSRPIEQIEKMFQLRELNKNLHKDLSNTENKQILTKAKI